MKNLANKIKSGESETLEFKTSFGKDAIETVVAFANTRGGRILIGISDDGCTAGVECHSETLQGWINEIKQATSPSVIPTIEAIRLGGKTVVCKEISDYPTMTFDYRESGDGYLASLEYRQQRVNITAKVGEKVGEKLTENQMAILTCIRHDSSISAREIAERVGISLRKVETNIKKMRENGFLERIGAARGGHWKVSDLGQ